MSSTPSVPNSLCSHSLLDSTQQPAHRRRTKESSKHTASIREIVACLDGSELSRGVVPHARLVSAALGARLTLLRVLEAEGGNAPDAIPADPLDWDIRQRAAQAQLDRVVEQIEDSESEIRSQLIQGRPAEQICGWAERNEIDLTVLCSHGASGLTEFELASTARKLIDRIPGSLLLVPGKVAARTREEVRYRQILVPLDGSSRAESVIPLAMRIADAQGAELVLVHIVPTPEIFRIGPLDAEAGELERRVLEHNHRAASAYLDRLKLRSGHPRTRVRMVVARDGSARTRLDQLIREERPDLVVMSAHGSTGRLDCSCGSVADYALTHATTPLLVLRDREARRMRRVDPAPTRIVEGPPPAGPIAS